MKNMGRVLVKVRGRGVVATLRYFFFLIQIISAMHLTLCGYVIIVISFIAGKKTHENCIFLGFLQKFDLAKNW